ncbi:hypothetical protein BC940DRAFT_40543 [Gongronella butleri]|nr:hypothetical protein BC940DRAFT_40543 [Gongronella butleri]
MQKSVNEHFGTLGQGTGGKREASVVHNCHRHADHALARAHSTKKGSTPCGRAVLSIFGHCQEKGQMGPRRLHPKDTDHSRRHGACHLVQGWRATMGHLISHRPQMSQICRFYPSDLISDAFVFFLDFQLLFYSINIKRLVFASCTMNRKSTADRRKRKKNDTKQQKRP